ncbi:unnamed protein product, partial [Effrenium voratum]
RFSRFDREKQIKATHVTADAAFSWQPLAKVPMSMPSCTPRSPSPPLDAPEALCRLSLMNPVIFSSIVWALASTGYATWEVPKALLTSPELLQQQLQLRIRSIPVPNSSPRYQQFKEYYTREHDAQLQEYKAQVQRHGFNWQALLHGLGAGAMLLAASLAVLEYRCGLLSYWMEAAEIWWSSAQQHLAQQRQKWKEAADHRKVERLIQEIGEGEDCTGKSMKRRQDVRRPKEPVKLQAPKARTAGAEEPKDSKEGKEVRDAKDTKKEEQDVPDVKELEPVEAKAMAYPKKDATAFADLKTESIRSSHMRERLRSKVLERHCRTAQEKPTEKEQQAPAPGVRKVDTKKGDPDVEAALRQLRGAPRPALSGEALLREAQELLSRLEAEEFLRELETEEERARQAAGKKKAKRCKAAARAKATAKKKASPVETPVQVKALEAQSESEAPGPEHPEESRCDSADDKPMAEEKSSDSSQATDRSESDSEPRSSGEASSDVSTEVPEPEKEAPTNSPLSRWVREEPQQTRVGRAQRGPVPNHEGRILRAQKTETPHRMLARQARPAPCPAPRKVPAQARRRPLNYAEAASGQQQVPEELEELMTSMGLGRSRDDVLAFLNANSSEEWRAQQGELSSRSMKELSRLATDLLRNLEPEQQETFDGVRAGAQILEWVRGKSDQEKREASPDQDATRSYLRAEAPEFVPAQTSEPEVGQSMVANVMLPGDLPPGCQILMVPMQLAQMPQMIFEEQMPPEQLPMAMPMLGQMPGVQLVTMPLSPEWAEPMPEPSDPDPTDPTDEAKEFGGYNTDDECESLFCEDLTMRRQMTY